MAKEQLEDAKRRAYRWFAEPDETGLDIFLGLFSELLTEFARDRTEKVELPVQGFRVRLKRNSEMFLKGDGPVVDNMMHSLRSAQ